MESGPGDPEAGSLSVPAARHLAACVYWAKGSEAPRQGAPLRPFSYPGRTVECAVSRPNTHYRPPLPLEYIFPRQGCSPRRVGHSLRSTASLAVSETIGGRFFRRVERGRERPLGRSSTKSYLADTRARDLIIVRSGRRSFGRSLTLGAARSRVGHWCIEVFSVAITPCERGDGSEKGPKRGYHPSIHGW